MWDLITLAQEVKCLQVYGCVYETLRLFPLAVEHGVVVMSARLNPVGSQFSILVF